VAYTDSTEEVVARNFILTELPDVVINIVDASNLERNLYLTTQLLVLGVGVVIALNMIDMAQGLGLVIDQALLSKLLGVPVVATVGSRGKGIDELLDAAVAVAAKGQAAVADQRHADYGQEVEPHVVELTAAVVRHSTDGREAGHDRWLAAKLIEGDTQVHALLADRCGAKAPAVLEQAARLRKHIETALGRPAEIVLADRRYGFLAGACAEALRRPAEAGRSVSDRIDAIVTNRYLGLPIFALMMYAVFQLTFLIGNPIVDWLDGLKELLAHSVRQAWPDGQMLLLRDLLTSGVIEGVGAVLAFTPLIVLLYLAIAILEDSGYMARAAFVLDRMMHRIGLHGKSFIPMLIGFGCTVPGIMATRILETRRDRLTTMLVLPLMSCGARLPVYVLLLGAFFPARALAGVHVGGLTLMTVTNQALPFLWWCPHPEGPYLL
jgi:ferrous iron transport protein B